MHNSTITQNVLILADYSCILKLSYIVGLRNAPCVEYFSYSHRVFHIYYAALLPRRGPHCVALCLSVCLSVRPVNGSSLPCGRAVSFVLYFAGRIYVGRSAAQACLQCCCWVWAAGPNNISILKLQETQLSPTNRATH